VVGYDGPPSFEDRPSPSRGGGTTPKKPGSDLMAELAMAIGSPRDFSPSSEPRNPSMAGRPGYRGPANLPKGGSQGYDKVHYSLKGPQVAKVQSLVAYQLFCKDENQNLIEIDPEILEAEITAIKQNETMKGQIAKERKGVFKISFRGRYVGEYTFNIFVRGALEKKPIFKEPVPLQLIAGETIVTTEMFFSISGWGMHGGTVGKPLAFEILVKDNQGHPLDCDTQKLLAVLMLGQRKLNGYSTRLAPGKYQAEFTPPAPGQYVVIIEYGGQEVCKAGIEYSLSIDAYSTLVVDPPKEVAIGQQNTFVIQAKGDGGENINTGGERFEVSSSGPAGGITGMVVRDELNGKYTVRFTCTKPGSFKFFILLKGIEIKGSPVQIVAK